MLGDRIKAARESGGLTQEDLAARVHVVRQTVSRWEKGQSVPGADTLVAVAEATGTNVVDLIGGESVPPKDLKEVAVQTALLREQVAMQDRRFSRAAFLAKRAALAFAVVAIAALAACAVVSVNTPYSFARISVGYAIDGESEVDNSPRVVDININYRGDTYTLGYSYPMADAEVFEGLVNGSLSYLGDGASKIQLIEHLLEGSIENAGGEVLQVTYEDADGIYMQEGEFVLDDDGGVVREGLMRN